MRFFTILCLMCFGLSASPILKEKTANNREILSLCERMERAMRPEIGEEGWVKYRSALEFAAVKHEGTFRKDKNKTPYIIHPMGVSYSLFREGDIRDLDPLIAALLHDTLEDTDTSYDEIKALFGEKVASAVSELTNDPNLTTEENKQRQVDHAPHLSKIAKLVKLSDRLYNIRDLNAPPPSWDQEKIANYRAWGKKLLLALKGTNEKLEKALSDEISWQESQIDETASSRFIGELREKWTFASDHLPVGIETGSIRFGSWNILATPYLHYIEKNDQGLKDSLILKLNTPEKNGLTARENLILKEIVSYLDRFSAFTLQEVTPEMFDALKAALPSHIALYPAAKEDLNTELVILFDTNKFHFLGFENHPFQINPKRGFAVIDLIEKNEAKKYRFIGVHLPGGPKGKAARTELTLDLLRNCDPDFVTIVMGDMNASKEAIMTHFERSQNILHREMPFKRVDTPYFTHVNTALEKASIDQIYIAGGKGEALPSSAFSEDVERIDRLL